jgi:hypothetical protein
MALTIGGSALQSDAEHRFDPAFARNALRFMDVTTVPSPEGEIPPEVLSLTMRTRCRDVPPSGSSIEALARLTALTF